VYSGSGRCGWVNFYALQVTAAWQVTAALSEPSIHNCHNN
jgi:hypothetical protein